MVLSFIVISDMTSSMNIDFESEYYYRNQILGMYGKLPSYCYFGDIDIESSIKERLEWWRDIKLELNTRMEKKQQETLDFLESNPKAMEVIDAWIEHLE